MNIKNEPKLKELISKNVEINIRYISKICNNQQGKQDLCKFKKTHKKYCSKRPLMIYYIRKKLRRKSYEGKVVIKRNEFIDILVIG